MSKSRIDIYLVENKYAETRAKAQRLIMAGHVLINEIPVEKSSQTVSDSDIIRVKEKIKYVSRGAFKLEKALLCFDIDVKGKNFVDIGSSTGGFTDVLLQNKALHVTCVDVGYGQLAWKIRNNQRVTVLERTNARYLTLDQIGKAVDGVVCDVSFISLKKILPVMQNITNNEGFIVVLIKPQFEAGKGQVGKKGIVKDKKVHMQIIQEIIDFTNENTQFVPEKLEYSPIKGQKGNVEYLLYASKSSNHKIENEDVKNIVESAHSQLQ
ncbi:MAG: TlyA family RNA methyltransferase [Clostridiales bacterium]|nr:TlyA family RNA methyltransferase [Clostridiales bacterium]